MEAEWKSLLIHSVKLRCNNQVSVHLGLYLLSFCSPSLNRKLTPTTTTTTSSSSSSQPLWLTAVTTCCANWKRPWLVLFPNRSGCCPVVFLSAGGWQLAFRLRCSAVWTLALPCRPLTSLPLQKQGQVQNHVEREETADLHLFFFLFFFLSLALQCSWWELFWNKWNQSSGG